MTLFACDQDLLIENKHFFGKLVDILKRNTDITDILPIQHSKVPLIKMKFRGIDIDLLFARISAPFIRSDMNSLQDDGILKNCDEASILSLNGCRVTDLILELVPNKENFRVLLRWVKLWAKKNRGIYSNVIGYLGGATWAILWAKVCQKYPDFKPNQLLLKFFWFFINWKWPEPVLIQEIIDSSDNVKITKISSIWNPLYKSKNIMTIVTPGFPAFNSTFNVSNTTKNIILKEFQRASELMIKIANKELPWNRLFEKFDFLNEYQFYLKIDVLTNKYDDQKYLGYIESKLK